MRFRLDGWLSVGSVCVVLPIAYFLAYGFYGFTDTDQGFIHGLSWRILQGEVPYKDFIYVRPPLSLYLHSIPLLFPFPVLLERLLFYLGCGLTVYTTTRSLQAYFNFQPIGISPAVFSAISLVFVIHNFAPMPWHTLDGLIFASLGVFLIVKAQINWGYAYLGLMSFVLAAMCKQSFYPLLVAGPALVWMLKGKQFFIRATAMWGLTLIALATLLWVNVPGWVQLFLNQTQGALSLRDLLQVGVFQYGKALVLILAVVLITWRIQQDFLLPGNWKYLPSAIYGAVFFGLLGLHVYKSLMAQVYIGPSFGFGQVFFLLGLGVMLKRMWINTQAYGLVVFLLLIAWCGALSWGYATPMLFFTPVIFSFLYMLYDSMNFRVPRYFYAGVTFVLLWIFAMLYQYPYREAPRREITYYAGEVFDVLKGIWVGEKMYGKYEELKDLHREYGNTFTVLPGMPAAHYLTQSNNPLSVDWAHNAEAQLPKQFPRLIGQLENEVEVVFLEKGKEKRIREEGHYGSEIALYVMENWQLVKECEYFAVYAPEKKS